MKKYLKVLQISFMEYFIYRLNFFLWRFRSIISFLSLIFFWQAVYGARSEVFGYQKTQMLTYVVGISILQGITLGGRTADLAGMIKSGDVINKFLLKPWNVITTWFFRDLADRSLNLVFVIAEIIILVRLLNLPVYIPDKANTWIIFIFLSLLAICLNFLISYLLSCVGFWVDNVWAPRWLFGVIFLEFMSGKYFPLDVLPQLLFKAINLTPFPYLVYFPLQVYLEKVTVIEAVKALLILFFWTIIIYKFTRYVWKKGLADYTAYGG
jgi:ABC-2 type transport system permease protein